MRRVPTLFACLATVAGCAPSPAAETERSAAGILNGQAEDGEPATLYVGNAAANVDCTGALVSERVVLTAKHCVLGFAQDSWSAWVGPNREQGTYGVESIVMTPGQELDGQDVALMTLADSPGIPPYALGRDFGEYEEGDTFSLVGYGVTETGGDNRKRRTSSDLYEVGPALGDNLFDNEFLLQGEATGAASGDSGGPVLDEEGTLVGVMSRANEQYFTFCSRTDRFLDLIDAAIAAAGDVPEPECETDEDCPAGNCIGGDCVEVEDPDAGVPDDCDTNPDLCAPPLGELGDECTTKDDCTTSLCGRPEGEDSGLCTMECDDDAACGAGFSCVASNEGSGVCWPAADDGGPGLTGGSSCSAFRQTERGSAAVPWLLALAAIGGLGWSRGRRAAAGPGKPWHAGPRGRPRAAPRAPEPSSNLRPPRDV